MTGLSTERLGSTADSTQYELPSDQSIYEQFDRYYSTTREIPLLNRHDMEDAVSKSYHRTSRAVQICILAILSLVETDGQIHTGPELGMSSSSPFLESLCKMMNTTLEAAEDGAIGLEMVIGSLASYLSFRSLARWNKAWYYLQQAITLAQIMGLDCIEKHDPRAEPKATICALKTCYTLYVLG